MRDGLVKITQGTDTVRVDPELGQGNVSKAISTFNFAKILRIEGVEKPGGPGMKVTYKYKKETQYSYIPCRGVIW